MPSVADAIARTLRAYGVEFAFGIPGNDVLETIRACEAAGIRFVLAKSEPSAAFMADAVFQLTGRPAALIPALGPGIANAISGIAGAQMERTAMIVLAGEMGRRNLAIYNHQVFDHVALARPVTKYAEALNPARAAQQTAKALDIALTHPAGPVLLNLPADAARADAGEQAFHAPAPRAATRLADDDARRLGARIASASRALALIGRGALTGATPDAVRGFVEAWRMPFLATYKAKGVVDEHHPLSLGALGLSPVIDAEVKRLVDEADLLVLIGFDPIELRDAWLDAWEATRAVMTFDWGPLDHRIFPSGTQAHGDVPEMLAQLRPENPADGTTGWAPARLDALRHAVGEIVRPRAPAGRISPAALFHAVDARVADDWLMVVDVGAHRILANHVIRCRAPGQLLQSNGLGCMGYALGAAIGAQLVRPQAPVVALVGDGCLLMSLGELALIAELGLPIVVVALNDASLSLIKLKREKLQLGGTDPAVTDFRSPDFVQLAKGFGADAVRVERVEDFARSLERALAARRFTVIEAMIDPREYWEQM
jgi:acetolactate synthase-1/2/3 large subunit